MSACATDKVMTDSLLVKRKYNKGFMINTNLNAKNKRNTTPEPTHFASSTKETELLEIANQSDKKVAPMVKKEKTLAKQIIHSKQQALSLASTIFTKKLDPTHTQKITKNGLKKIVTTKTKPHQMLSDVWRDVMAWVGFGFGITSLIFMLFAFAFYGFATVAFTFAVIGLVTSILGMKSYDAKPFAIVGLITSSITLLLFLLVYLLFFVLILALV